MPTAHKWQPITDLDEDPKALTDGELEPLHRVWLHQKSDLIERGVLEEFEKQLRREWAIETGIIENIYTLDRGVTRTLIEKGIDAALIPHGASNQDSATVARIIQDHYEALDAMLDFVAGQRPLSTSYVKELHAALLRNQNTYSVVDSLGQASERTLEKGQYKTYPNSPTRLDGSVHEYCPPDHVASEMDNLLALHHRHQERGTPPEVEAAWLHHRFAQIHPFADGNGRVARAIASMMFIKANWFPLIIKRDDRTRYIEALEKADRHDLRPLVALFAQTQRTAMIQAVEIAHEVRPPESAEEAIAAARTRLLQRGQSTPETWGAAIDMAWELVEIGTERLGQVASQLRQEIGPLRSYSEFAVQRVGDLRDYGTAVVILHLAVGQRNRLHLGFRSIGRRGIIGITADFTAEGGASVELGDGGFQINYEEALEHARARFSVWLERVIVEGLTEWRRGL